jgi:hypothetical protein
MRRSFKSAGAGEKENEEVCTFLSLPFWSGIEQVVTTIL